MARVVFISLYDRNAYGQRIMCANLKRHGHDCRMIFLKRYVLEPAAVLADVADDEYPWMGVNRDGRIFKFASNSRISQRELELLRQTIEEIQPHFIGMTVNTPLRSQAKLVTSFLKEHFEIPVVWGGYDPTVNPEACLGHADFCCIGEGDQTVLDMANCADDGVPFDSIPNLAYRRGDTTVTNPKHPAERELDRYPWRDNGPAGMYLIENDAIEPNHAGLNDKGDKTYLTMSARGCPYKCTYCCEATLKDLYTGEKFLRRRSAEDVVAELADARARFGIERVGFEDEIFAMDLKWLETFAALYKEKVNLPFVAYIYPTRNVEAILTLLKGAGLEYCCLALESGSERINREIYQRVYDRELFLKTAGLLDQLQIRFYTDIITYSPYEEEADLRATLDVLLDMNDLLRRPFDIWINKLFVLPGTKLSRKMAEEGVEIAPTDRDTLFNFYARLYWIASFGTQTRPLVERLLTMTCFYKAPWLLDMETVRDWITRHHPSEARSIAPKDLMPLNRAAQNAAAAAFNEDHEMVALPALSPVGCH